MGVEEWEKVRYSHVDIKKVLQDGRWFFNNSKMPINALINHKLVLCNKVSILAYRELVVGRGGGGGGGGGGSISWYTLTRLNCANNEKFFYIAI